MTGEAKTRFMKPIVNRNTGVSKEIRARLFWSLRVWKNSKELDSAGIRAERGCPRKTVIEQAECVCLWA